MLMKGYIRKESQSITIQNPSGVGTDGERTYGTASSALAVVAPITAEQRTVYGDSVADIIFLILPTYTVQLGSKIGWDSKTYTVNNFRRLYEFKGQLFAYEVAVNG